MASGGMPKPSENARAAFQALVPDAPGVTTRPMFGNLAAFVNGNMFTGLFGEDLFVRLQDADRDRLIEQGGADFEPMPGRAMKGYVTLPPGWSARPDATRELMSQALTWTQTLPAKEAKPAKERRR